MKTKALSSFFLIVMCWCGLATAQDAFLSEEEAFATESTGENETRPSPALTFPQAGLSAQIQWVMPPKAGPHPSSFYLTFWNSATGTPENGPFVDPAVKVGSFSRMTCCGTIYKNTVTKVAPGKYLVTTQPLAKGEWEIYLQLGTGGGAEKRFVVVKL